MLNYRRDIDGLRALAITAVVLFHAGGSAFPGGYVGVDIFFVISGFLITSIIVKAQSQNAFSFTTFYARRARRILPASIAMLAVVTAVCFVIMLPPDLVQYGKILNFTTLFAANFKFTEIGYFDAVFHDNPLLHMWSLAVEEQFYFIWPALLWVMALSGPARYRRVLVFGLAIISLVLSVIFVQVWPRTAFFHLPSRGWELLAGAILALGYVPPVRSQRVAEWLSVLGLALVAAPIFLYTETTPFPGLAAIPPVIGCCLLIHANTGFATRVGRVLSLPPVVFVGLISYSLYLWHWPVIALPKYVLMRSLTPMETTLAVAVSILLAVLSWRYVERPFRQPHAAPLETRRWLGASRRSGAGWATAAVASVAILCGFGAYFRVSDGVFWRNPAAFAVLTNKDEKHPCSAKEKKGLLDCDLGPSGNEDIAFWGDSHAFAFIPTVYDVFGRGKAYLRTGCQPLVGVTAVTPQGVELTKDCRARNDEVIRRIAEQRPKLVILAARWNFSESGRHEDDRGENGIYYIKNSKVSLTRENSRAAFETALRDTIDRLTAFGAKVLIMGQAPEMWVDAARCVAIARYLTGSEQACTSVPRRYYEQRLAYFNQVLRANAEHNLGKVYVFWPAPTFCDAAQCYAYLDNIPLYQDQTHISVAGARYLSAPLRAALPDAFRLNKGGYPKSASTLPRTGTPETQRKDQ